MRDITDPFSPVSSSKCLIDLEDDRDLIDRLVEYTQDILEQGGFHGNKQSEGSVSGAAVAAATDLLSQSGGRVLLFNSNTCLNGFGSAGTNKKGFDLYCPTDTNLKNLAERLKEGKVSVDLFSMSLKHYDLASLAHLCKATGGQVYFYSVSKNDWDLQ